MMRPRVAIYQDLPGGRVRLGLFPSTGSLREIAAAFHRRHPSAHDAGPLYIVTRLKVCGRWADTGEYLPMDPPAPRLGR
jgi:hypothetical protein